MDGNIIHSAHRIRVNLLVIIEATSSHWTWPHCSSSPSWIFGLLYNFIIIFYIYFPLNTKCSFFFIRKIQKWLKKLWFFSTQMFSFQQELVLKAQMKSLPIVINCDKLILHAHFKWWKRLLLCYSEALHKSFHHCQPSSSPKKWFSVPQKQNELHTHIIIPNTCLTAPGEF